jgi:YVTN family beta-propeller protein
VIDEMEQLEQLCAAVPSPDRQRLAAARAQLSTAIRGETAGHAARRLRLAVSLTLRHRWLGRRWLGWAAPLAAAAAVTGVILGSQGVFSPVHRPVPSSSTHDPGLGLAHPATAYVAGQSGTVTPILTATGTALKPIRIGKEYGQVSSAIVFRPDGKTAYVLSGTVLGGGSGTVTPIRTATSTALKPIAVGQDPRALAITPDGTTIYVTNYQSGTVTPIRTATNTALAPIRVGGNPWAIAIAPTGKTAYVADTQPGTVTPIRPPPPPLPRSGRDDSPRDRDHPRRQDRLRPEQRFRHGDPDPDRHQHRPCSHQGASWIFQHGHHARRQDHLCPRPGLEPGPGGHGDPDPDCHQHRPAVHSHRSCLA